jgi:hypothetical protein
MVLVSLALAFWVHRRSDRKVPFLRLVLGVAVLAAFFAVVALPYASQDTIPDEQLFSILLFRAPHHLLPSSFDASEWLQGALFLVAMVLAYRHLRKEGLPNGFTASLLKILVGCLLVFFLAGYLFVEVWPLKAAFLAIPFRATSFFNWLGFVAIGSSIAIRLSRSNETGEGVFLLGSMVNPVSAGLGQIAVALKLRNRLSRRFVRMGVLAIYVAGAAFTDPRGFTQFLIIAGLAAWFLLGPQQSWARAAAIGASVALASGLVVFQSLSHSSSALDRVGPEILPSHMEGPEVDIARAARAATPPDAVILTPPTFGTFRVLSERAIVVDTHVIPYQETAMAEWMERVTAVYGSDSQLGFESGDLEIDSLDTLRNSYMPPSDSEIQALSSVYGISHAVLPKGAQTNFPVISVTDEYVLVDLKADP